MSQALQTHKESKSGRNFTHTQTQFLKTNEEGPHSSSPTYNLVVKNETSRMTLALKYWLCHLLLV